MWLENKKPTYKDTTRAEDPSTTFNENPDNNEYSINERTRQTLKGSREIVEKPINNIKKKVSEADNYRKKMLALESKKLQLLENEREEDAL